MITYALEILGLALVVVFAATFGARWGILAAGVALILLGQAFDGLRIGRRPQQQPYGIVSASEVEP